MGKQKRFVCRPLLALHGVALALGAACTDSDGVEDNVPPRVGVSLGQPSGARISESEACETLRSALEGANERLKCGRALATCPALIRPGASLSCLEFDRGSVDACVEMVEGYRRCGELSARPCVVVGVEGSRSAGCVPPIFPPPVDAASEAGQEAGAASDAGADFDASEGGSAQVSDASVEGGPNDAALAWDAAGSPGDSGLDADADGG